MSASNSTSRAAAYLRRPATGHAWRQMTRTVGLFATVWYVAACRGTDAEDTVVEVAPPPPLTLRLDLPVAGSFAGNATQGDRLEVMGVVSDPFARVTVDGQPADVRLDGRFVASLPAEDLRGYFVEVQAERDAFGGGTPTAEDAAELAVPVYGGLDPSASWPGGLGLRLTDRALGGLETVIEGAVAGLIDPNALLGDLDLPEVPLEGVTLSLGDITVGDLDVELQSIEQGLLVGVGAPGLSIELIVAIDALFGLEVPVVLSLQGAGLGAGLDIVTSPSGEVSLVVQEPTIVVEGLDLDLGILTDLLGDLAVVEDISDAILGGGEGLVQDLLSDVLPSGQVIPLGGPLAFDTDLLGTQLSLRVANLDADAQGIFAELGLGVGESLPIGRPDEAPYLALPVLSPEVEGADVVLTLHEGVVQPLLESDLLSALDVLDGDLGLGALGATLIGLEDLPGGSQVPPYNDVCIGLSLGDLALARLGDSPDDLLHLVFADAAVNIGIEPALGGECEPWLVVDYVFDIAVGLDGSELSLGLGLPDARINYYGASGANEEVLLADLGGRLQGLVGLVGGFAGLDLGDLLGGLGDTEIAGLPLDLGALTLAVVDVSPGLGPDGLPLDGQAQVALQLFGPAE